MMTEDETQESGDGQDTGTPTSHNEDMLGFELQNKFESWKTLRRLHEEEWLKDLRAYNQINENAANAPIGEGNKAKTQPVTTYHAHIYSGMARAKADTAYARIINALFMGAEKPWGINPSPIPEIEGDEEIQGFEEAGMLDKTLYAYAMTQIQREAAERAEAMEKEMEDQQVDMQFEPKLKASIREATVIGTGVAKGIVPGIKRKQGWKLMPKRDEWTGEVLRDALGRPQITWDMVTEEVPYPSMGDGNLSVFDVFPDPYATNEDNMSGCFQRHVLTRSQLEDLMDDEQFDKEKIRQILRDNQNGNHVALWHENERRWIARAQDTSGSLSGRFDVMEYWGEVQGRLLQMLGIDEMDALDDYRVYFCAVWVCAGKTILARIAPMKRQRVPFNFFKYADIPHQFWGIGPVRMLRLDALPMQNAAIRALCDDLTLNTLPMREVNVNWLKDGEDPRAVGPGHTFLRDNGDPAEAAIRWYQPTSNVKSIMPVLDVSRRMGDDSTNMPSYIQGMQIKGANETASGTSMLMGAANVSERTVVKNFEDGLLRPLLQSQFDWNMQWNPKDDIKGDHVITVKGLTALTSKEVQSQRLIEFMQISASNPFIAQRIDWLYCIKETARALEIDPDKAVPEPEQQQAEMMNGQGYAQPIIDPNQPGGMAGAGGELGGGAPRLDFP